MQYCKDSCELIAAFTVVITLWHLYLEVRQLKAIKLPNPPVNLAKLYDKKEFSKTQAYNVDRWWLGFYKGVWGLTLGLTQLLSGYYVALWDVALLVLQQVGLDNSYQITHAITFVLLEEGISLVLGLPWSLYSTFVVEERHGFNKQTLSLFFTDLVKQVLLGLVLLPPVMGTMVYLLQHSGPYLPLYLWAFLLVVSLFFMAIYPIWIMPLFNKLDPLPEGQLRTSIEELASSIDFPLKKMYLIDGSKRSSHSNAYFYGFWRSKRLVLYDTLIEQCTQEQTLAVLAHELGHWKLNHTWRLFLLSQVVIFVQFAGFTVFRQFSASLLPSFGFTNTLNVYLVFMIYNLVLSPLNEVLGFGQNFLSRQFEYQADNFAAMKLDKAEDLKGGLIHLDQQNKSPLNVDPWYSTYNHTHPTLVERLDAIDAAAKKGK